MLEQPREAMETAALQQKLQSLTSRLSSIKERFGGTTREDSLYEHGEPTKEDLDTLEECCKLLEDPSTIFLSIPKTSPLPGVTSRMARIFETGHVLYGENSQVYDDEVTDYGILTGGEAKNLLDSFQEVLQQQMAEIQPKLDAVQNALEKLK
jgi:6-phosphogluconate dehydrogenase (decarboxylating)